MDIGFSSLARIPELSTDKKRFFVLRIPNSYSLKMLENGQFLVGTRKDAVKARVVAFCDLENKTEYRLATNLSSENNDLLEAVSNQEIGEIYRQRWPTRIIMEVLMGVAARRVDAP